MRARLLDIGSAVCNDCYMDTRERLRRDCLRYFLRHGVANLSLRPLAAAVGTSARMLLHYFGSKEELIAEVMAEVQTRLQDAFRELSGKGRDDDLLAKFWQVLSHRTNQPSLRLLFEVQMLALQNPKRYRRYLTSTSTSWRRLIEAALPAKRRNAADATLYNAVIDGLLLELLSTGDHRRTSRALLLFAASCGQPRKRGTR
jgi:AcrR family transcriptional regulator